MISKRFQIDEENSNNRVDIFLANNLDAISRGIVQQLISEGKVTIKVKRRNAITYSNRLISSKSHLSLKQMAKMKLKISQSM